MSTPTHILTPDMIDQVRIDQQAIAESVRELATIMAHNRSQSPDVITANTTYLNEGDPHRILGVDKSRHSVQVSASTDGFYISPSRSALDTFAGSAVGSGPGFLVPQFPQTLRIEYTGELFAVSTGAAGFLYVLTESFADTF